MKYIVHHNVNVTYSTHYKELNTVKSRATDQLKTLIAINGTIVDLSTVPSCLKMFSIRPTSSPFFLPQSYTSQR